MTEREINANPGRKEYVKNLANRKPGITTNKMKGVRAANCVPYAPNNINIPREEFIRIRKVEKAVKAKMALKEKEIREEATLEVKREQDAARKEVEQTIENDRSGVELEGEDPGVESQESESVQEIDDTSSIDLQSKTVAELKVLASEENIDISGLSKKQEIIDAIMND